MIRTLIQTTILSTSLLVPSMALAQDDVQVQTTDLGHGLYMLATDQAGNVGILVGEDGVFMIDTQYERLAPLIDHAQREISGQDVELVLNTHWHGDHVQGNAYFAERGAVIAAHHTVRERLTHPQTSHLLGSTAEPLAGAFLPSLNLGDHFTITMNGQTADIVHTPTAHTDGDLFIVFEEANVIHAGDLLFSGMFPYIDLDTGGTVEGYIAGMEAIIARSDENTKIISGHGPLSTRADLEASVAMLREGKARVQALVDQGLTLAQIQEANPLADFHEDWNWRFITTERMTTTLYRDITGRLE
ncbi:MBL fold metallo-hydrolase [Woodsholea maritima]|uniref:MBL fold metallo-hydrolase n=1 Tax=Woodsholea maritima TaxID=240237 RepID=UPI0012EA49FF|nr:MBL fold metallo-hydrolase [Woodsholea maritima]